MFILNDGDSGLENNKGDLERRVNPLSRVPDKIYYAAANFLNALFSTHYHPDTLRHTLVHSTEGVTALYYNGQNFCHSLIAGVKAGWRELYKAKK